ADARRKRLVVGSNATERRACEARNARREGGHPRLRAGRTPELRGMLYNLEREGMKSAEPTTTAYGDLARRLSIALRLEAPTIAIRFAPGDVEAPNFGSPIAPPNEAGRTGAVAAGCRF